MFELWQAEQAEIEKAHPRVCQAIEDCVDHIIIGNHDAGADWLCGHWTMPSLIMRGVYVTHGHEFDAFSSGPLAWVGRACAWLAGAAERLIHRDADLWLTNLAYRVRGAGRYGRPEAYREDALEYVRRNAGIGVPLAERRIVLGHTHAYRPMEAPASAGGRYGNAGTWTGEKRDALWVECDSAK